MKIADIDLMINDFCKKEGIKIINGKISAFDAARIEIFIDAVKKNHKEGVRLKKSQPVLIKDVLKNMRILK